MDAEVTPQIMSEAGPESRPESRAGIGADTGPVQAVFQPQAMRRNVGQAVQLLKTLANESRLSIMCVLAEGERSVGALNERIELSQSALSQHLAVLREQGLVRTRRESQTIYYSLTDSEAIPLIEALHDIYCAADD
jgi:DNA-binding transcriptional ArsR family regulator